MNQNASPKKQSRRRFLGNVGGVTAATLTVGIPALSILSAETAEAAEIGPLNSPQRVNKAYQIRHKAALDQKSQEMPAHLVNSDEETYPNFIGSYSKALPHNSLGEVDSNAYYALVNAMTTGRSADFALVPLGGTARLTNPQSALAFELEGADSHHLDIPAPPAFNSEERGGEMAEVYWQALTRDIPISQYGSDPTIAQAVVDLRQFSNFSSVTAANIFRGPTAGDLLGPYISQFLWKPIPYGPGTITQQYRVPVSGDNHLTNYSAWLNTQNGVPPASTTTFDPSLRYIRNGRDLAEWLRRDFTYQGFLNAALILLSFGPNALDDANPYKFSANQNGFCTFGGPHILDVVARVANCALKASWYQKWSVHRTLRPEAMAGRVHNHKTGSASYPINSKLLNSQAVTKVFSSTGGYLLPMAYPEGCPTHPSYPAGHATISGACTTVLKAFFRESFNIPTPVVAADDGLSLNPYGGSLTVGGELDKLASNISIGRDTAGVHYRSDGVQGMLLGEALAVSMLRDYRGTFNESFAGFSLTKFDGTTIVI